MQAMLLPLRWLGNLPFKNIKKENSVDGLLTKVLPSVAEEICSLHAVASAGHALFRAVANDGCVDDAAEDALHGPEDAPADEAGHQADHVRICTALDAHAVGQRDLQLAGRNDPARE